MTLRGILTHKVRCERRRGDGRGHLVRVRIGSLSGLLVLGERRGAGAQGSIPEVRASCHSYFLFGVVIDLSEAFS